MVTKREKVKTRKFKYYLFGNDMNKSVCICSSYFSIIIIIIIKYFK